MPGVEYPCRRSDVRIRGYGALFDAINEGDLNFDRLREPIGSVPVAKIPDRSGGEHFVLGVDVSNWLHPDAGCSPERTFCHTYVRGSDNRK